MTMTPNEINSATQGYDIPFASLAAQFNSQCIHIFLLFLMTMGGEMLRSSFSWLRGGIQWKGWCCGWGKVRKWKDADADAGAGNLCKQSLLSSLEASLTQVWIVVLFCVWIEGLLSGKPQGKRCENDESRGRIL